jgi:hypothetical protein
MNKCARIVGLAFCLALLVLPGGALAKADSNGKGRGFVFSFFDLKGTNGYTIEAGELREGDSPPTAAINAKRGQLRANYEVPAAIGPDLQATFGSVGSVSLSFERRKRSASHPRRGCAVIEESGVFRGTFSFAGENGFTEAGATSIPGEVVRFPNGFCALGGDRPNPRVPSFLRATSLTARTPTRNGFVEFGATTLHADHELNFGALAQERLGAMKISRSADAHTFDGIGVLTPNKLGRIAVDPPPPFVGNASFRDPAGGPPSWTGSLSVSLPGAPTVPLAGPDFVARLCHNHSLLRQCKAPLPPRRDGRARAQGSGSQSQAFWDVRLSWSR